MSVVIKMTGDREIADYLQSLPSVVRDKITRKWEDMASRVSQRMKEKVSGEVLNVRTGRLRNSLYARVYVGTEKVTLSFGSRWDVPYASIHEYGGMINHPGVPETQGGVMPMRDKRGVIQKFSKSVLPHTIWMPKRSYIKSTRDEMVPSINAALRQAINEVPRGRF